MYEADDKMISLIRDDYSLLHMLGAFGIKMGFGDKTVREVCEDQGVDTYTFMAVVNFAINGHLDNESISKLSVITLLRYLRAAHAFCLSFVSKYNLLNFAIKILWNEESNFSL